MRATNLENEEDLRMVALLLHHMGPAANEVFNSFNLDIDIEYFTPKVNISFEGHIFFYRRQLEKESLEDFVTALTNLSLFCNFGNLRESLMKDIFTCGLSSPYIDIKQRLIEADQITLEKAVNLTKAMNMSRVQASQLSSEKVEEDQNFVGALNVKRSEHRSQQRGRNS